MNTRKNKAVVTEIATAQVENETGATAATETAVTNGNEGADEEPAKRKVARHWLVNANGAKVDDEESATGIGYQVLGSSGEFTYQTGLTAGSREAMLAVFGAKTLATNESSQARNNAKGAASADEQMEAVRERFALLDTGKWVDRTREGVGAKIDKDALAGAIVAVAGTAGKTLDYAAVRQKLEEDAAFVRATRQVPAIATEYAARAGRPAKSLEDVLAGF